MGTPSSPSSASQGMSLKTIVLDLKLLECVKKLDGSLGSERLAFKPEGYNFWEWRGHKIHYVVQGEGLPLVLIHGFGASVFHWRYCKFLFYIVNSHSFLY